MYDRASLFIFSLFIYFPLLSCSYLVPPSWKCVLWSTCRSFNSYQVISCIFVFFNPSAVTMTTFIPVNNIHYSVWLRYFIVIWSTDVFCNLIYRYVLWFDLQICSVIWSTDMFCNLIYRYVLWFDLQICSVIWFTDMFCNLIYRYVL